MLMRFAQVSNDGVYSRSKDVNPRIGYATMVLNRANLVGIAAQFLAKYVFHSQAHALPHSRICYIIRGVTIAVRYSCVRRQFKGARGSASEEMKVMDYQMQQYRYYLFFFVFLELPQTNTFENIRLLPLIATVFGFLLTGRMMQEVYAQFEKGLANHVLIALDRSIMIYSHIILIGFF